jgi:NAD(P) transhydrogenase
VSIGIQPNERGLIQVNQYYQTTLPHIYAAGDCIGFPALASTSMEQGRLASCHMFDKNSFPEGYKGIKQFPFGIYTIPEISLIGYSEESLTAMRMSYEVGIARYKELAKGQMLGGGYGLLKILFDTRTHEILGVHCIGEGATEIIHIGQVAMDAKCPIEYFRDAVFNYPTMAEAYRVAAINGLQKTHDHVSA